MNSSVFFLSLEVTQQWMKENILFRVLCNPLGLSFQKAVGPGYFCFSSLAVKVMSVCSLHRHLASSGNKRWRETPGPSPKRASVVLPTHIGFEGLSLMAALLCSEPQTRFPGKIHISESKNKVSSWVSTLQSPTPPHSYTHRRREEKHKNRALFPGRILHGGGLEAPSGELHCPFLEGNVTAVWFSLSHCATFTVQSVCISFVKASPFMEMNPSQKNLVVIISPLNLKSAFFSLLI